MDKDDLPFLRGVALVFLAAMFGIAVIAIGLSSGNEPAPTTPTVSNEAQGFCEVGVYKLLEAIDSGADISDAREMVEKFCFID